MNHVMDLRVEMLAQPTTGALVVLSGGYIDAMNPPEVRGRMDDYIRMVGLPSKVLPFQSSPHVHQSLWRLVAKTLDVLKPSPLVIVGHSFGGSAAVSVARSIRLPVDLLVTCDSIQTTPEDVSPNRVPPNVRLNVNTYTIPTPSWVQAPFPIGQRNVRDTDALDGIVNVGLAYNLGGAIAHRNCFYEFAGGDRYQRPNVLLDTTQAVLRGQAPAFAAPLQTLASSVRIVIELEMGGVRTTLRP